MDVDLPHSMQSPTRDSQVSLVFASPRKLPRDRDLAGRVVVLDLAFASEASSGGFAKITLPFILRLGPRLVAWVDHHDHTEHERFRNDPRFVLATKAEQGACSELVTPELVQRAGRVDTIVCHTDFDGLASAAKWLRGGLECYPGCDTDARAIDTRLGQASDRAVTVDRALRGRPHDTSLFGLVVRHLRTGMQDNSLWEPIREAASDLAALEDEGHRASLGFVRLDPGVVMLDISHWPKRLDKTHLLMLGQAQEPIAVLVDRNTINIAARFDSGVNLLRLLGLSGGMPTRVSVDRKRLDEVCRALGIDRSDAERVLVGR